MFRVVLREQWLSDKSLSTSFGFVPCAVGHAANATVAFRIEIEEISSLCLQDTLVAGRMGLYLHHGAPSVPFARQDCRHLRADRLDVEKGLREARGKMRCGRWLLDLSLWPGKRPRFHGCGSKIGIQNRTLVN